MCFMFLCLWYLCIYVYGRVFAREKAAEAGTGEAPTLSARKVSTNPVLAQH